MNVTFLLLLSLSYQPSQNSVLGEDQGFRLTASQQDAFFKTFPALTPEQQWQTAQAFQWGVGEHPKNHAMAAAYLHGITKTGKAHPFYAKSQYTLGRMYLFALGLPQDETKAAEKFRAAAREGFTDAFWQLGWLHLLDRRTENSLDQAKLLFKQGALAGNEQARWLLQVIEKKADLASREQPPEIIEPLTGMVLGKVPKGCFQRTAYLPMGSKRNPPATHEVQITQDFYLGRYEVTQAQWQRIMGHSSPYDVSGNSDTPMVGINWYQVQLFVRRLNWLSPMAGFRLPTEAEWEYACRANTVTAFNTGERFEPHHGNIDFRFTDRDLESFKGAPTAVGTYPPNQWGFYDMHGNVLEWCADDWCVLNLQQRQDPIGNCQNGLKVIRGGSWFFGPSVARSGYRDLHKPQDLGKSLGFRLAKTIRN